MHNEMLLVLLKHDLQLMHSKQDEYLLMLLEAAAACIRSEGITLQETVNDAQLQTMYAAYLYRHRAEKENAMPRMLRFQLNNRLLAEKMKVPKHVV